LSPAEQPWLKTEVDDEISNAGNKYTKRALDAMEGREFSIRVVRSRLGSIIDVLRQLSDATLLEQKAEVRLWTNLVAMYLDNELWQSVTTLVKLRIINPDIDGVKQLKTMRSGPSR
jgi:hypothetical protein